MISIIFVTFSLVLKKLAKIVCYNVRMSEMEEAQKVEEERRQKEEEEN